MEKNPTPPFGLCFSREKRYGALSKLFLRTSRLLSFSLLSLSWLLFPRIFVHSANGMQIYIASRTSLLLWQTRIVCVLFAAAEFLRSSSSSPSFLLFHSLLVSLLRNLSIFVSLPHQTTRSLLISQTGQLLHLRYSAASVAEHPSVDAFNFASMYIFLFLSIFPSPRASNIRVEISGCSKASQRLYACVPHFLIANYHFGIISAVRILEKDLQLMS